MSFPLMPFADVGEASGSQTLVGGQSFVVPLGITSLSATLNGAGGGGGGGNTEFGGNGGAGARVVQTALAVTPNETLTISGGVAGSAGTNGTLNNATSGSPGTTISLLRGGTTLMSASAGAGGSRANSFGGDDFSGSNGANGTTGTGGTVTSGAGSSGGTGGRNSPSVTPTAGAAGNVTITWS